MRAMLLVLMVACGDNLDPAPDAAALVGPDAAVDAALDAPPDAGCWKHVTASCGDVLIDLCVPYHGCAYYTCEGMGYGYCGPG